MADTSVDRWGIAEADFPAAGTPAEKLRFLLNYAVLAPSRRNTQPWRFKLHETAVDLYADRSRALPAVDPGDRELVMSCGAALFYLRAAIRHYGYRPLVEAFPDPANPDLLARVRLGHALPALPEDHLLFRAMPERRTNRMPFVGWHLTPGLQLSLQIAANDENAWLHLIVGPATRRAVAALVATGDRMQWSDPEFRREVAEWLHPNPGAAHDGIPGASLGMSDMASYVAPVLIRNLDIGPGQAAKDQRLAEQAPVLAVLGTEGDAPPYWLAAGQAVTRVLLRAAVDGVAGSFLNGPVVVPELRTQLTELAGRAGFPQLLLRLGYGVPVPVTPRRSVDEVLI